MAEANPTPMATAENVNGGWSLAYGDETYFLKRTSLFRFRFLLLQAESNIGTLYENTGFSLLRRKFVVDLPDVFPLPVQGFLFYLAANQFFN